MSNDHKTVTDFIPVSNISPMSREQLYQNFQKYQIDTIAKLFRDWLQKENRELNFYLTGENGMTVSATFTGETAQKAQLLMNIFHETPLDKIKQIFNSNRGLLAAEVIKNLEELTPIRMLMDELVAEMTALEQPDKKYVSRAALMAELEDILKAKTITPYRRSRINNALKRACLNCLGGGKVVRTTSRREARGGVSNQLIIRKEIDSRSADCRVCEGTGINPKHERSMTELLLCESEEKTIGGISDYDEGHHDKHGIIGAITQETLSKPDVPPVNMNGLTIIDDLVNDDE